MNVPMLRKANAAIDCGWGKLLFGQTFADGAALVRALCDEADGKRNLAFYVDSPHLVLAHAPQEVFLDPSHSLRLDLDTLTPGIRRARGLSIVPIRTAAEVEEANRIYHVHHMMELDTEVVLAHRDDDQVDFLIATTEDGRIVGVVVGVDHVACFGDAGNGSSLWSLAVDPQAPLPGIGEDLVRALAERFRERGRAFMDVSVLHNNEQAVRFYEHLAFRHIKTFCLKKRNVVNERLYAGPEMDADYNPYARLIIDEARRRGIGVEPIDPAGGFFRLSLGGRSIACRESLSDLTSAVAMSRCDDKTVTRRAMQAAGLRVPAQTTAGTPEANARFLEQYGRIVVKPARGEQGHGVAVDLTTPEEVETAVANAAKIADVVLLEQFVQGDDLRIIVIGGAVVAAAIRKPAEVVGTGEHTIRDLIERQSRRRAAATGGESHIPMDGETERCVRRAGYGFDDVLPAGEHLRVRKAANLHTGGTIHDVTAKLHPALADAAVRAAAALEIPVVGMDFIVQAPDQPDYYMIEANERPGLANHDPQPTAEKFIDLLFPRTVSRRTD